ncbi:hypothetical protein ELI55_17810 [Rhizobium ruizarguesonis]|uniref:hypothetical protein n=1 Tax=Rhizobium ruizarguesonis TaxID=2081791 RepID=UPI0010303CF4|nr:hypothetical protein [Rhizobium ruizarguesonis]TAU06574.1 hypothetical protein ELI55_17810 [Rhizobium ruizarguesonis]TAZ41450.1 hypothetical protein ELH74_19525 [Rhizobium ruizarguesonis]
MAQVIKNFTASGAVTHRHLVVYTATDRVLAQATGAAGERLAGVVDFPGGAVSGARFDVVLFGPAVVECGGNILPGQNIVSDAQGRAVVAAPGAGVNAAIAGRLLVNGALGDFAEAFVNPDQIQG